MGLTFPLRDRLRPSMTQLGLPHHAFYHSQGKDGRIVVVAVEGDTPMVLHLAPSVTHVTGKDVLTMVHAQLISTATGVSAVTALTDLDVHAVQKFCDRTVLVHNAM